MKPIMSEPARDESQKPEVVRLTTTDRLWALLEAQQQSSDAMLEQIRGLRTDLIQSSSANREELIKIHTSIDALRDGVEDTERAVKDLALTPSLLRGVVLAVVLGSITIMAAMGAQVGISWAQGGTSGQVTVTPTQTP